MSMINCKECGKAYSNKANSCPNCACPTSYNEEVEDKHEMDNIVCSECGAMYERHLYACPNCGCPTEHNQSLQEVKVEENPDSTVMGNGVTTMVSMRMEGAPSQSLKERTMRGFLKSSYTTANSQDNSNNGDEPLTENLKSEQESSRLRNRIDDLKEQDRFSTEQTINAVRQWEKSNDYEAIIRTNNYQSIPEKKWRRSFKLLSVTVIVSWVLALTLGYYFYLESLNGYKGNAYRGYYFDIIVGFLVQYLSICALYWIFAFIAFAIRKKGSEKRSVSANVIGDLAIIIILGIFLNAGIIYSGGADLRITAVFFSILTFGLFSYCYHRNKKEKSRHVE